MHPWKDPFYKNDHILSFAKYTTGLQEEFAETTKYQNQVSQETMAQRLIDGIQVQNNLTITLAKTKIKDDKFGNCLGAVSYVATKVNEALGVVKDNKDQGRRGNWRRVSAVEGRR